MRPPSAELTLADDADLATASAAVRELPGARETGRREQTLVFLDTFDGRLRAAGLTAVQRDDEPPPGGAVDEARGLRALLPVARVRSRIAAFAVLDDEDKTVVRLEVEQPEAVRARQAPLPLAPRLHVRSVLGYDKRYRQVLDALAGDGRWQDADRSLFDEASLAVGRDPAGVSSKPRVKLARDLRADAAAGILLSRLADICELNVPGTLDDLDTEFLHDLRVSVRRARSVLRELRGVHDPALRAHVREELKWVQAATGPVRDLDVQLLDWDGLVAGLDDGRRVDLEPLRELLLVRREAALAQLRAELQGRRFADALTVWRELAEGPPAPPGDPSRPHAALAVQDLAADRIRRVHRRMVRDGRDIDDASPAEALHDLRKRGKELRYLLELFGGLFPDDVVKPMVKALKQLQDVLGRFQDRAVQAELLQDAGRELARRRSGPAALMALGLVVDALQADQRAAREEFHERFAAFAADEQRRLVRDTFPKLAAS